MTTRFPGLVLTDWRVRLVHDHPRLFTDARLIHTAQGPTLTASGWPEVSDGWRAVVETACRRISAAVAAETAAEFAVLEIDQKWGLLRISVSSIALTGAARAAVDLAVDLAEARSAHVCALCGAPGRLMEMRGWLTVRCEAHADGHVPVRDATGVQIITRSVDGAVRRAARRYDPAHDSFVPAPLPPDDDA